jgi:hypothetical protein
MLLQDIVALKPQGFKLREAAVRKGRTRKFRRDGRYRNRFPKQGSTSLRHLTVA